MYENILYTIQCFIIIYNTAHIQKLGKLSENNKDKMLDMNLIKYTHKEFIVGARLKNITN